MMEKLPPVARRYHRDRDRYLAEFEKVYRGVMRTSTPERKKRWQKVSNMLYRWTPFDGRDWADVYRVLEWLEKRM